MFDFTRINAVKVVESGSDGFHPSEREDPPVDSEVPSLSIHRPVRELLALDFEHWSVEELLAVRSAIDERLPQRKLADMDLEEEAVLAYVQIKALTNVSMGAEAVPLNQRAQVANSLSASLRQLASLQKEMYSSERIKNLESALYESLADLPDEVKARFFETYESSYRRLQAKKQLTGRK